MADQRYFESWSAQMTCNPRTHPPQTEHPAPCSNNPFRSRPVAGSRTYSPNHVHGGPSTSASQPTPSVSFPHMDSTLRFHRVEADRSMPTSSFDNRIKTWAVGESQPGAERPRSPQRSTNPFDHVTRSSFPEQHSLPRRDTIDVTDEWNRQGRNNQDFYPVQDATRDDGRWPSNANQAAWQDKPTFQGRFRTGYVPEYGSPMPALPNDVSSSLSSHAATPPSVAFSQLRPRTDIRMPRQENPTTGQHPQYAWQGTQRTSQRGPLLQDKSGEGVSALNILILGETGVGKSTFINAFTNYLAFPSMKYALSENGLKCVIPSAFTWQSLDGDEYVSRHISVKPNCGSHNNPESLKHEQDGSRGQSATQETKTYEMLMDGTTVRLLDTPGIGDTRGSAQDKQNMDDILAKLRTVDELHGILILLKPNNARLSLMFNFCIKELLTHLHQDAAKNIVFGFTNARSTSFRPGDTYGVLKSMLETPTYRSVGITLNRHTTYCFDSESFRCLAAHQSGVDIHDMGDVQDYVMSWEKSARETYRMLEHFKPDVTTPHRVAQTWNLYQTRELVRILTIPMADITQTINNNIALQGEQQRDLKDALNKGESLESALHLNQIEYEMRPLDRPRTVCSDAACVEYHDNKKHYKSYCHDPCHLRNVRVDKIQCEELMQCYAFGCGKSQECEKCHHSWQVHLHVLWEPVEVTNKVVDKAVQQRLLDNADGVDVMKEAIRSRETLIESYKYERKIIQKAAGQFAVFLKNSAITAYNDSKLEYLDHLIDEEKAKIQAGGSKKRLKDLLADRKQHQEEVKTLNEYAKAGAKDRLLDQEGIKDLIKKLFSLELTGPNLQSVAAQLEDISDSTKESNGDRSLGTKALASASGFLASITGRDPAKKSTLPTSMSGTSSSPRAGGMGTTNPSFQQMLRPFKGKSGSGGLEGQVKKDLQ